MLFYIFLNKYTCYQPNNTILLDDITRFQSEIFNNIKISKTTIVENNIEKKSYMQFWDYCKTHSSKLSLELQ